MKDVQNEHDPRRIEIQKVGVKNVKYPIVVLDKHNQTQSTVATINMYADLPHDFKGTHMSRFIDVVNEYYVDISMHNFLDMLDKVRNFLEASRAYAEVIFPYFIEKRAPVSGERSMMEYICEYMGEVSDHYQHFYVGIQVPIATVCPCSLEISDAGAHNQRGIVRVKLLFDKFFWIEDVISIVEQSGSSEVYTLLKREDEKYITEQAFKRPRFVEDVVREVTEQLEATGDFRWFSVEAENFESIHNHSAYAFVERGSID
ncbi:MAG: GTP cyclohydrolase I FolE2 [Spirochaetaceae bacterium]|nr:MAG: GTP cyclohydrolase I FolE2 [Spirochaetaceae bacterium]